MAAPRQLLHTEWFDHALQQVAGVARADLILSDELFRLAMYADLVPVLPGCKELRVYQTKEFLRSDGHLVKILIYFVLRENESVELQHIEILEEDMHD